MRYIKEFANAIALQAAVDNGELGRPYLCYLQDQGKIAWDSEEPGPTPHDYSKDYLTFRVTGNGVIKWVKNQLEKTIYYSINDGAWTSTKGMTLSVVAGDVIRFKGNNAQYCSSTILQYRSSFIGSTAQFVVEGNIMSMIYGDDFIEKQSLTQKYTVLGFFENCTGLTSAENLVLPATTLTNSCYYNLFKGCSSLTTAPELPATDLVPNCYYQMFYGCSSLNYIKCLATNISATNCTNNWVSGVQTTSGTFVKKSGVTWSSGASGIPNNWTVIEE